MVTATRLKVGVDVPWVTSWTEEALGQVRPCPSVGGRLAIDQQARPGEGRPNYSQNHLVRQRWSVRAMQCPMCGLPTEANDRWTETGRLRSAGDLREKGLSHLLPAQMPDKQRVLDAGAIAPLHKRCVSHSHDRCPHLQAHARERLRFPARWFVTPLFVEARAPSPSQTPAVAAISFLQLWGLPG